MYIQGYQIIQMIGRGSFATTYLAKKNSIYYALKLIRSNLLEKTSHFTQRIEREILILKSLDNPYVVKYIDDGYIHDRDQLNRYLVMEYAHGELLKSYIRRKKLSVGEACLLGKHLFEGIYAVHRQHVVHRDLKPSNLMITSHRLDVKILDFGLSKSLEYRALTKWGQNLGTYAYMAPEQLLSSHEVDYRADFYSLGVILYEMLAGEKPLRIMNKQDAMSKLLVETPMSLNHRFYGIPRPVSELVDVLLRKKPDERYVQHYDIIACLDSFAN